MRSREKTIGRANHLWRLRELYPVPVEGRIVVEAAVLWVADGVWREIFQFIISVYDCNLSAARGTVW